MHVYVYTWVSLVATLGRVSGTAVALFTYDGAAAKALHNSNAFCLAHSVITVFGSNLGAVGVTALARIGNSVCEASIWISESAATCKVPTGSGAQLDVAVTVRGGVTTLSHSFSYDFAGVTQIVLYGTSPESSTGLQVPVRPAPEVAMLDFYRQGVFVSDMPIVASILPLDSR
ncbi:hypothetical protein T484DRAFT_1788396 [Baffinella frigidus]|nr:hypothetical protein T484DRAFT_1788396 [Cryptophyta sp. CCMP2293]